MKKIFVLLVTAVLALSAVDAMAQWGPSGYGNKYGSLRGNGGDGWIRTGYRGMAEMGHGVSFEDGCYALEFTTTHGYQFNPYFYLGGIVSFGFRGVERSYNDIDRENVFAFRIAADPRVYFLKSRVTPFAGLQLGLDYCDGGFVYFGGSVGVRVALNSRFALNFSILVNSGYWFIGEGMCKIGFEF